MSLWRYWLVALALFTAVVRPAMGIYHGDLILDHVEALPTAVLASLVSILLAKAKSVESRRNLAAFAVPTLAGLAFIAALWAASNR